MSDKAFEHVLRFHEVRTHSGGTVWLPLVTVDLIQPGGNRVSLPLLFDTGASVTTLRHDLYPLLGLPSWDSGQREETQAAGSSALAVAYRYQATIEFLGRAVQCPINLMQLPPNPLFVGLFGREQVFEYFGFGFWEKTHELYITLTP